MQYIRKTARYNGKKYEATGKTEREAMMKGTGRRTVPQIYIGETHVGGYDDLAALDRAGKLTALLAS